MQTRVIFCKRLRPFMVELFLNDIWDDATRVCGCECVCVCVCYLLLVFPTVIFPFFHIPYSIPLSPHVQLNEAVTDQFCNQKYVIQSTTTIYSVILYNLIVKCYIYLLRK